MFTVDYEVPLSVNALVESIEVELLEDGRAHVHFIGIYPPTDSDHALAIAGAVALETVRAEQRFPFAGAADN